MYKYFKSHTDASFKVYAAVFIVLAIYFSTYLSEIIYMKKNTYDFLLQTTDLLTISYVLVPLFLILLVNSISASSLNSFRLLRFEKKSTYFHNVLRSLVLITTKFLVLLISVMLGLALFSLDHKNEWSRFSEKYFENFPVLLQNYSPIHVFIISCSLLWLFLYCLGVFYFVLIIATKSTVISLIGTIVVVIFNMAITISQLDFISTLFFTKHLDFLQYIYLHKTRMLVFPFELYLYWFIFFVILYYIGYQLMHRFDLELKKGV